MKRYKYNNKKNNRKEKKDKNKVYSKESKVDNDYYSFGFFVGGY